MEPFVTPTPTDTGFSKGPFYRYTMQTELFTSFGKFIDDPMGIDVIAFGRTSQVYASQVAHPIEFAKLAAAAGPTAPGLPRLCRVVSMRPVS